MSPKDTAIEPVERITLDDLKHRADTIKDLAVGEVKDGVARVAALDATKKALIVVGVTVAVVSIAFYMGSRSGARSRM